MQEETLLATIPEEMAGWRTDQALAALFPVYSRARLQDWIRRGRATLQGRRSRPSERVLGGERVVVRVEPERRALWHPQALPLAIVHQDPDIVVVDKPAGLVVHPGAGNLDGTLVNGLLDRFPELAEVPRAGVVHRLDKNTSGLLVVARTLSAHRHLVEALATRAVRREYDAVVLGALLAGGTVEAPVGRHPIDRTRMTVTHSGKRARTHYRVRTRFQGHTHVRVTLDSGRTHQIRVHMAHIGHPVLGDPVYGRRPGKAPAGTDPERWTLVGRFPRQALHASRLTLTHPRDGRRMRFEAPLPPDMAGLLEALRALDASPAARRMTAPRTRSGNPE